MSRNYISVAAIGFLFSVASFGFAPQAHAETIVDIAAGNKDFSSLVSAVSSQGLVDTLKGNGPFTVFAPTNDAFANIQPFIKKTLDKNPALLKEVLLYHVVSGNVKAADVTKLTSAKTVQGSRAKVTAMNGKVMIDQAEVVTADIAASNGTVHVINKVLVPRSIIAAAATAEVQEILAKIMELKNEGAMLDAQN